MDGGGRGVATEAKPKRRFIDRPVFRRNIRREILWFVSQAKAPRLRTMREFAEQEIVLPDGPYKGNRFRCERQPYSGLLFDAMDSGFWPRIAATGPVQSGKTLQASIIPLVYHLFEIQETVIFGLPSLDMSGDKWREDILPVIEASRYREFLPTRGAGSKGGGNITAVQFGNGVTLRFMTGGGGDKSRAGFTSRVLVVTEVDGMDKAGEASREADKITQLEARTKAFGSRRRIYLECTVSVEEGRIWREYQNGTASRIVVPCPECGAWVRPEREHLHGWQDADNVIEASERSAFCCPECGVTWSVEQRVEACLKGRLVHRGQEIGEDGEIHGGPPATDTLGFRWSAFDNLFLTPGDIGASEWKAARADDEENAEKEMRQFVWCLPYEPPVWEDAPLDIHTLKRRMADLRPKGDVPAETKYLTLGADVGKRLIHWAAVAWLEDGTAHVVDYGRVEVPIDHMAEEVAILNGLRQLRDLVEEGWKFGSSKWIPDQVWIDRSWRPEVVEAFVRESNGATPGPKQRYRPSMGRGSSQQHARAYNQPKGKTSVVRYVGEGYHIAYDSESKVYRVEVDADHWKTWVHKRLGTPAGTPGCMTLYDSKDKNEHVGFAKHITAERQISEFVAGKGTVVRWEQKHRNNHWLDALYNACAAGHLAGFRIIETRTPTAAVARPRVRTRTRPDGSPYLSIARKD